MRSSLGSIEDLGDGRFRVRVPAGFDHKTGKRIRPSKIVRGSRRDAERERALLLARLGRASDVSLTVTGFFEDMWLPTKDARRKKTVESYASRIRSCITPYIGHIALSALDGYVVERWLSDLRSDGKGPQTVRHARAVLKNGLRAAVRWKLVDHDPTEGVELPEVDYRPAVLTAEQANAYLDAFSGHAIELIIVVMLATGVRRSEAAALDWSDFDFEDGFVEIRRGLHQMGGEVWFEEPKSRTSRRALELPPWALATLKRLRGAGPLVPDEGGRMAPDKISRLYRDFIADAKLPYVPLRNLRNTVGTHLYNAGVPLGAIADQFGHSSTEITRKHYVARSHRQVNRASVAALSALRVGQNGPNGPAKHGRNPQEPEDQSAKVV